MKIKSIASVLLGLTLANAKIVYLIRHGEKLNDKVTNLSLKGEARASCLINIFGNNGTLPSPNKIYAQNPTEKKQSTRPKDTVIPLSDHLGLQLDLSYTSGKVKKLASDIMTIPNEVVLVSWSNDKIPEIAEQLGIANPPDWDSKVFDDIWVLTDGNTVIENNTMNSGLDNTTLDNTTGNTNVNNNINSKSTNTNTVNTKENTNRVKNNTANVSKDINNNNNGQIEYNIHNNNLNTAYNTIQSNQNQNTVNSNFKRNVFNMEIIKQDINECITGKMAVLKEQSSDSNTLKNNAAMIIFSVILSILIYIY